MMFRSLGLGLLPCPRSLSCAQMAHWEMLARLGLLLMVFLLAGVVRHVRVP